MSSKNEFLSLSVIHLEDNWKYYDKYLFPEFQQFLKYWCITRFYRKSKSSLSSKGFGFYLMIALWRNSLVGEQKPTVFSEVTVLVLSFILCSTQPQIWQWCVCSEASETSPKRENPGDIVCLLFRVHCEQPSIHGESGSLKVRLEQDQNPTEAHLSCLLLPCVLWGATGLL